MKFLVLIFVSALCLFYNKMDMRDTLGGVSLVAQFRSFERSLEISIGTYSFLLLKNW